MISMIAVTSVQCIGKLLFLVMLLRKSCVALDQLFLFGTAIELEIAFDNVNSNFTKEVFVVYLSIASSSNNFEFQTTVGVFLVLIFRNT